MLQTQSRQTGIGPWRLFGRIEHLPAERFRSKRIYRPAKRRAPKVQNPLYQNV